ncbi:M10 family metallopeptidase C-terminal domain-containing protein [Neosynechococcus sphagnicola]|uniref:M10 family metallopeptidase C-terminal domain-containing protein n=1 Tax=Neosynechococcus sphagnicola TaxID=1501145 RepID=UPI00068C107D|nr:M10 family metallopeptidase C-terminal domain-containing protein [Neosynechococcus sphagnicola]
MKLLSGGSLNDVLTGNTLNNSLVGGTGNDSLQGDAGDDTLDGGANNDIYIFDADAALGSDTITDTVSGTDGLDFSSTTTQAITVNLGTVGSSQTVNGNLALTLATGTQIENVTGGSLNDVITGSTLDNSLFGGAGNDTLSGGNGNDTLWGGSGNDSLSGGSGNDIFGFNSLADVRDTIQDFVSGQDLIHVAAAGLTGLGGAGTLSVNRYGEGATLATASTAAYLANGSISSAALLAVTSGANVLIYYDPTSSNTSTGDETLFATLNTQTIANISNANFVIF